MDRKARELYGEVKTTLKDTPIYKNLNNRKVKGSDKIDGLTVVHYKDEKIATIHPGLGIIVGSEYSGMDDADIYIIGKIDGRNLGYIGYKDGVQVEKKISDKEAPAKMSKVQLVLKKVEDGGNKELYAIDVGSKPVKLENIDRKLKDIEKEMY